MPTLIAQPTRITSAGNKPKLIDEYVGRVNSKTSSVSVAHMRSPQGWMEPGQAPEFDEFTIVLKGTVVVRYKGGEMKVTAGQGVVAHSGEWCSTRLQTKAERSTSPCACQRSRWRWCTGTQNSRRPWNRTPTRTILGSPWILLEFQRG